MKSFLLSKTLWLNTIAFVAFIVQGIWGFAISPEIQAMILAVINFILRTITKEPIVWGRVK